MYQRVAVTRAGINLVAWQLGRSDSLVAPARDGTGTGRHRHGTVPYTVSDPYMFQVLAEQRFTHTHQATELNSTSERIKINRNLVLFFVWYNSVSCGRES